jgi:alkanesulfonate monooxygenase SsuD/methylene tetrahydromethanopterin reductase-like flavin-dependent oxidoreductase (luciferase family)
MRVGLVLPMSSGEPGRVLSFARRAEELGFDGVFAFDHLFAPGGPPDRPSLEAYATLAAVAAATSRVRLGTLVTRASLRSAGLLAKQAVALDDVSGGRFILGIGTGDGLSRAEHRTYGLPYLGTEARGPHLVETVRAVRALFVGDAYLGGEWVPPIRGPILPPPRTTGGPPVWIGGASARAVRAAAAVADGWNGWALPVPEFARRAAQLRMEAAGREVEATWGGAAVVGLDESDAARRSSERRRRGIVGDGFSGDVGAAVAWLASLGEAGARWAILLAAGGADRMEHIGLEVLPALRRASA